MRRALVITNAEAGSNDADSVEQALDILHDAGIDVTIAATSSTDELDSVLGARDGREILVAGGDGSLHAVIDSLHSGDGLTGPIGLIPLGTGNDFARGLGLPLDPAEAAAVVVAGQTRQLDLLIDHDGGIVVNAVHAGVGADAGREATSLKPVLGKIGYAVGAVLAEVKTQGHRLRVEADGEVLADGRHHVLQVGIGNGAFIGGGTPLAPDADPGDGKVDVVVSFAVSRLNRLLYAVRLHRGTHHEREDVQMTRVSKVRITGSGFWCNADGELTGPHTAKTWHVDAQAITMLVPAATRGT